MKLLLAILAAGAVFGAYSYGKKVGHDQGKAEVYGRMAACITAGQATSLVAFLNCIVDGVSNE